MMMPHVSVFLTEVTGTNSMFSLPHIDSHTIEAGHSP